MIEYRIVNLVACGGIDPIRNTTLEKLAVKLNDALKIDVEYDPETFPGLIIKSNYPKASFLLFNSGKIVCTGADSFEGLKAAFEMFEKKILPLIKKRGLK